MVVCWRPHAYIGHQLDRAALQPIEERFMARTIKDTSLDSRTARGRLRARGKPYYRSLEPGLHLGYRKPLAGSGKWVAGITSAARAMRSSPSRPLTIIRMRTEWQFSTIGRLKRRPGSGWSARSYAAGKTGPLTVRVVMQEYLEFLQNHRKTGGTARYAINAFILPELGEFKARIPNRRSASRLAR